MKTIDISGFGGSYEAGCQKMLMNGLKFLKEHPDFNWGGYKEFKNVFGLTMAESSEAEALDKAVCEGVDPSGAMHSGVVNHLAYIHKQGYDAWIAEAVRRGRTIYECPSEEELENTILISQIEWRLKLDGGYNPMAELFKNMPAENIITVDSNSPDSVREAAEKLAQRIKEFK